MDDEYEANENSKMLVQDEKDEEKLWQQNNRNKNKAPEDRCYDVDVMFKL